VQSVLARGARRSKTRYGSALDLFASGTAEIHIKSGRDLQTLASFDVTKSRGQLAADLGRFTAASAIAELTMRFATGEGHPELFDALIDTLDAIAQSPADASIDAALAGAWQIVAQMGFAPELDQCASCHNAIPNDSPASFSHPAGGVLCHRCSALAGGSRVLPSDARTTLRAWVGGAAARVTDDPSRRAHQRLLREFLSEHLADGRQLRAYDVWERNAWGTAVQATP
jgi:DNA repair protein RecO (recombination protein O)